MPLLDNACNEVGERDKAMSNSQEQAMPRRVARCQYVGRSLQFVEIFGERVDSGKAFNVMENFGSFTCDVIARMAFGQHRDMQRPGANPYLDFIKTFFPEVPNFSHNLTFLIPSKFGPRAARTRTLRFQWHFPRFAVPSAACTTLLPRAVARTRGIICRTRSPSSSISVVKRQAPQ